MKSENFKLIPLRNKNGEIFEYAKCSPQDFDILNKYKWNKNDGGYAKTMVNNINISMHKFIITVIDKIIIPDGYLIDHINVKDENNRLNNCRENLRIITIPQNAGNRSKRENVSSIYFGVGYRKDREKYYSQIIINGKHVSFGNHVNEIDAAIAYDIYVVQNSLLKPINFEDKIDFYKTCKPYISSRNTNTYYGVTKNRNRFDTRVNGVHIFYSKNEIECAKKYDSYIVDHKIDAGLNFPEDYPDYLPTKKIKIFKEDIDEKTCKIKFNSGKEVIILLESYEKIKYYTISHFDYVLLKIEQKTYLLHRYLMNVFDRNVLVDHIDGDPFNNRIDNLRKTNAKGNSENKKKRKNISYTNVYKKKNGTYYTSIHNSSIRYTKTHKTEEYAARDRDLQIMKQAPNSLYKKCFDDWNIPGKIKEWEVELFLEDLFE
jgi:hypothetical protein